MAKILCAKSGILFSCEHVSMTLHSREIAHPIFYLPQKKLFGLYAKWLDQSFPDIDSYLLYLALFDSTDLVEFRVPAEQCPNTKHIVSNNMIRLATVLPKVNTSVHPNLHVARFIISPETKTLETSHIWLETWEKNWEDFEDGYKEQARRADVHRLEQNLHNLIKNKDRNPIQYAKILSKWAADAGKFPLFQVTNPFTNLQTTCSEYWQDIIIRCVTDISIFDVPKADLEELLEHCMDTIEHGNIYAYSLVEFIKSGLKRRSNFLELGDLDSFSYRILDAQTSVEDANKLSMIDSAPKEKPIRENYPNKISYLIAKHKYDLAQKHLAEVEAKIDPQTELEFALQSSLKQDDAINNLDNPNETTLGDVSINGVKL